MKYIALLLPLTLLSFISPKSISGPLVSTHETPNLYESDRSYVQHNGKRLKFTTLKGKVTLIHVWASWCATTEGRPAEMKRLKEKYGDKLEIVHVTMDEDRAAWKKFIAKEKWNGIHLMKPQNLAIPLAKMVYIPKTKDGQTTYWIDVDTYFLIEPDGHHKVLGKSQSESQLSAAIKKAL